MDAVQVKPQVSVMPEQKQSNSRSAKDVASDFANKTTLHGIDEGVFGHLRLFWWLIIIACSSLAVVQVVTIIKR